MPGGGLVYGRQFSTDTPMALSNPGLYIVDLQSQWGYTSITLHYYIEVTLVP